MPTTRVDVSVAQPRDRPEREDEETDTLPMAAGSCKSANRIISPFAVLVLDTVAGLTGWWLEAVAGVV